MPSSWSPSVRFELQFTGENINLWGDKLNAVLGHADYSIAGWLAKPLTGDVALTTANAGDDEARAAMIKFTGAGPFVVTIPSVSKSYLIWNACSAAVTITTGAGSTVVIDPGDIIVVACDGANVKTPGYGGLSIKDYIAATAASAGAVPSPLGNTGKVLYAFNNTTVIWQQLTSANLSDTIARDAAALGRAVAMAFAASRRR